MSISRCKHCNAEHQWSWEEAFNKFGFDDGDGLVMTEAVASALRDRDYDVTVTPWGWHNIVITAIAKNGRSLIKSKANVGYDEPRSYLPKTIIALLDEAFGDDTEVEP